jgi:hypothetical protein
MTKPSPDRWLAVGGALIAVGAALGVGYWIYGMQASPHVSFWHLPGFVGVALAVLGLLALAVGFFAPDWPRGAHRSQRAGDHSTQIQSGRDTTIGQDD